MKFLALLLVASVAVLVNAQVPVPAPLPVPLPVPVPVVPPLPFIPPFFGGFFPRFGLGFGPFGFGGLGLGLGFGRFGLFGRRFFGKRSAEGFTESWLKANRTICRWEEARSVIRCEGEQTFECGAEARLDEIKGITVRLPSLNMIPDVIRTTGQKEVPAVRLFSRVTGTSTLVNPRTSKDVVLSIYSSPVITEAGWLVKDAKCYERLEGLATRLGADGIRFSFVERE